jgi:sigma-B regulation protein RsbU (phosphoserine phosphatase)
MTHIETAAVQAQLIERSHRIRTVLEHVRQNDQLVHLLKDINSALERIATGTYGICEVCNESIEEEYLRADPLVKVCLGHLSPGEQETIERDLELAARVQGKLLPSCNTRVNGWEFCYHYEPFGPVGGDYCDFIRPANEGGDMYFFIGDVSGKGVAASLLVSYLHATLRSLLPSDPVLPALVERVNRLLCETTLSSNFITLVAGRAAADGTVEFVNAGHCHPLVVRDGSIRSIETTGLPLGISFGARYRSVTTKLEADDAIFMYTDGLSESRNPGMEEYSDARISALVSRAFRADPQDLIGSVRKDLREFRGPSGTFDDLSIMAMRRVADRA